MYLEHAARLFLQLSVILVVCRLAGWVGRRWLGQTQVVSEMVAGVLLGPSFFGLLAPAAQHWLFPRQLAVVVGGEVAAVAHPSMVVLYALSQLGLVLYMFLVGLELDLGLLRGGARGAVTISAAGIVAPLLLGAALGLLLAGRDDLFRTGIAPAVAALFLGASLAITAFPMLARILYERGLARSRLGTLTLTAGSLDDAVAWCLLAVVLAVVDAVPARALLTIGGGALFAALLLGPGRALLARRLGRRGDGGLGAAGMVEVLLVLFGAAWIADLIGIYAVFGAFVAGVAMPRGALVAAVRERTELLTTTLLLPVFFVFSGLNTRIGLLDTARAWGLVGLVVALAILGKGVACAAAARFAGESWRDAATIGVLMNARGLMELILLDIGLAAGLITPTLFTVLVLMAVVTTLMASPLFHWIAGAARPVAIPPAPQ
ncbi:MAG TPA: cation:proton antiporter [Thermoanaerobaculia bacterium]|nr:cation:proton antiporter [Thermoanaerobaculia bacterium]